MLIPRRALLLLFPCLALAHPTPCSAPCAGGTETQISTTATTAPHETPSSTTVIDHKSEQLSEPVRQSPEPCSRLTCLRKVGGPSYVNKNLDEDLDEDLDEEAPNSPEELTQSLDKRGIFPSKITEWPKRMKDKIKQMRWGWEGQGNGQGKRGKKQKSKGTQTTNQRRRKKKQRQRQRQRQNRKQRKKQKKEQEAAAAVAAGPSTPIPTVIEDDIKPSDILFELHLDKRHAEELEAPYLPESEDELEDGTDEQEQEE